MPECLETGGWKQGEPVVIDGIRHVQVLNVFRELVAPVPLLFVFLDAGEQARNERLNRRDKSNTESLAVAESRPRNTTSYQVLPALSNMTLSNDEGAEDELVRRIENRLRALM